VQRAAEIQDLYAFNRWANARMRAAVAPLTSEEFTRDLKNSFPSVRDTLVHVMGAEWVWLTRWMGNSPTAMPAEWRDYTLDQINTEWAALEAAQKAFVDNLTDAELDRMVAYRNFAGQSHTNELWQLLRHMVNHSTYHRGQITTMLRQLGHPATPTDMVAYFREQRAALAT
jgi:uncharacterized damage-inducible protein DinB